MNLPMLLGLADAGLDDADTDAAGNVYVCDSINARVYRFQPSGILTDAFDIQPGVGNGESSGLSLAVAPDSTFYIGDPTGGLVSRYSETGDPVGEFSVSSLLSICSGPDGLLYALSSDEDIERINVYNAFGFFINEMAAPARYHAHLDPAFVNIDSDSQGNVYVSYGMAPYRLWKVKDGGSVLETWGREIDYPEDAVLISDMAVDKATGEVHVLLACKKSGLQQIDTFSPDGEFIGTAGIPHSDNLFGVICSGPESRIYLLDTGIGPGSGDLLCIEAS